MIHEHISLIIAQSHSFFLNVSLIRLLGCWHLCIYKSIWTPIIGEKLVPEAQDDNEHDKHAVGVKDGCVVGHLPRSIHVAINRHVRAMPPASI